MSSPSKTLSMITAGDQIAKSPLNNSKSKYLYSFSRASRFTDPSKKIDYPMYNLSSWKNDRAASIGYGTKYDFTKENKDKCQNFYNISKDFNPKTSDAPSYTFGLGRSSFEKVYYETNKMIDKSIPGPGIYSYTKPFGHESPKYTMSTKQDDKGLKDKTKQPGPGEYNLVGINPKGIYPSSNFSNTPNINFGSSTEKRFKYSTKDKIPGPGQYECKWLIDGKGYNYISKFRSTGASTIVGKRPDMTSKFTSNYSKSIGNDYVIILNTIIIFLTNNIFLFFLLLLQ